MNDIEKTEHTIVAKSNEIDTCKNNDLQITGRKKEYSIVGDSLYASSSADEAPQWLVNIIDSVVNSVIGRSTSDLDTAIDSINKSLKELNTAKNQYEQLINIDERIDQIVVSKLETLNATVGQNNANIIQLDTVKTTPDEALAISVDHLNAQINNGDINALITKLNTVIANNEVSSVERIETLEAVYDENESIVREILTSASDEYSADASAVTDLKAYTSMNGNTAGGATTLLNDLNAEIDGNNTTVTSKFEYNSALAVNGLVTNAGFGLVNKASTNGNSEWSDAYSEFWINADKFKLTNNNATGSNNPFSIDATGVVPQITFNGVVDFTNTNIANGHTGTTTINGGLIDTDSLFAQSIVVSGELKSSVTATQNGTVFDTNGVRVYKDGILRVKLGYLG